MTQAA